MSPAPNPLFGGRAAELRRVAESLKTSRVVVLTGQPGVGKTQLAIEFAHRYGGYFAGGVFWMSCGVPEEIALQVAACGGPDAMELRADFADLALDDQLHLVLRSWQAETPRLLVFDDCGDEAALQEWLPSGGGAHVIVTSRRPNWERTARQSMLTVTPLDRAESMALVRRLRPDAPEPDNVLARVAEDMGDLPLALRMAGGFLRRYRGSVTPDSLLEQLRSREVLDQVATLLGEDEPVPAPGSRLARFNRRRSQQSPPVTRMFVLAHRWLERSDPAGRPALALLSRAACFAAGEPIPRHVLLEAAADTRSADSLVRLLDLGLLEADGERMVRLHQEVTEHVRLTRPDPAAEEAAEEAMIAWAQSVNDGGIADDRLLVVPHLDVAARATAESAETERAAAVCFELGRALWAAGDLRRARSWMERALEVRQQLLGPSDHRTIATLSALGSLLQAQGDLAGAQAALERALELAEATLGSRHPDTAIILTNLAWTLRFQGDLAGARDLLERALAVSEQVLGGDHPDTVARLDGLAVLLREQGSLAAALGYAERAMDVLERTLGPEHPRTLVAINSVGLLLQERGELEAARTCLEHTLRISEETLGPDHPDTATALDSMGTLLQAEGDLEAAREHIERALAIREAALGQDNPATGTSYTNMGLLLRQRGDLEGARPFLEQALIVSQRILGPYDPQTAASYNNLGSLLLELGDLYVAQPHLERALAIREQGLGADHPETAVSLANVAALHVAYGDPAGARAYLERALEIREEVLGAEDPLTAATAHELGRLLRSLGDVQKAMALFQRAMAVREQVLGPDHPDTLSSMTAHDELVRELGGRRPGWPPKRLPESEFFEQ